MQAQYALELHVQVQPVVCSKRPVQAGGDSRRIVVCHLLARPVLVQYHYITAQMVAIVIVIYIRLRPLVVGDKASVETYPVQNRERFVREIVYVMQRFRSYDGSCFQAVLFQFSREFLQAVSIQNGTEQAGVSPGFRNRQFSSVRRIADTDAVMSPEREFGRKIQQIERYGLYPSGQIFYAVPVGIVCQPRHIDSLCNLR